MDMHEHVAIRSLRMLARQQNNRPFLTSDREQLSVADLDARVKALADRLSESGLAEGAPVLLAGERSTQFVISLLAAWSIGCVPALIDASHPQSRIDYARLSIGCEWILEGDANYKLTKHPAQHLPIPDGTSHVLFTSGTSGRPAAVAVSQEPLEAMLDWYSTSFSSAKTDRFALLGGIGHDPVLRDILVPLSLGAQLFVPGPETFSTPGMLAKFLLDHAISVVHVTPALLEFGILSKGIEIPELRLILSGGAPLERELAKCALKWCPSAKLHNVYGSTETPQIASAYEVRAEDLVDGAPFLLPVGVGVAGATVFLAGEECLDGDPNEIIVRSPHLAIGYIGVKTRAGGFVFHPDETARTRIYRSGDLGHRTQNGQIVVTGRRDRQVSINGYRVALEEVEAAARRHESVAHARADLRTGALGTSVTLTVSSRLGLEITRAELRAHLQSELPPYALPGVVTIVTAELDSNHKTLTGFQAGHPRR